MKHVNLRAIDKSRKSVCLIEFDKTIHVKRKKRTDLAADDKRLEFRKHLCAHHVKKQLQVM